MGRCVGGGGEALLGSALSLAAFSQRSLFPLPSTHSSTPYPPTYSSRYPEHLWERIAPAPKKPREEAGEKSIGAETERLLSDFYAPFNRVRFRGWAGMWWVWVGGWVGECTNSTPRLRVRREGGLCAGGGGPGRWSAHVSRAAFTFACARLLRISAASSPIASHLAPFPKLTPIPTATGGAFG